MKYHASSSHSPLSQANQSGGDLVALVNRLFDIPFVWAERLQDRRRLAELDDHLLRDIGVSRSEIEEIASTPFWRR